MSRVCDPPSRYEVALGGVRGGAIPRGELLPLVVRSSHLSHPKLSSCLVGTNVQNLGFARRFSSRRPRCQVHLVVCLPYVESVFWRIYLDPSPQKAAISNMDGVGGKPGWAWIFILEGLATVIPGFMSFWIIQDFPDCAKFLTDTERTVVIRRLLGDDQYSAVGEKLRMKYIWESLSDWKTYLTSKQIFLFSNPFD